MRVKDKVKRVLESKPDTRSNDRELVLAVWEIEGFYLSDRQKELFKKCTPADSITRYRRDFREEYPPTEQVDQWRYDKYMETKYGRAVGWL